MLLCADADAASADLASGILACPSCGTGRLRAWGYGRERAIRVRGGGRRRLRPRRGRCRSCGATHVLLPSWAAPRRADAVSVIARAAAASALHGAGTARLGAELGVPAATVRGWLRRLRARAGQMLQEATAEFGRLVAPVIETPEGRDPSPPGPTGSQLGDARQPNLLNSACTVARGRGSALIMAHQIDLFCVPQPADTRRLEANQAVLCALRGLSPPSATAVLVMAWLQEATWQR
jgi:Domain of unknown function (DUF6431)